MFYPCYKTQKNGTSRQQIDKLVCQIYRPSWFHSTRNQKQCKPSLTSNSQLPDSFCLNPFLHEKTHQQTRFDDNKMSTFSHGWQPIFIGIGTYLSILGGVGNTTTPGMNWIALYFGNMELTPFFQRIASCECFSTSHPYFQLQGKSLTPFQVMYPTQKRNIQFKNVILIFFAFD